MFRTPSHKEAPYNVADSKLTLGTGRKGLYGVLSGATEVFDRR